MHCHYKEVLTQHIYTVRVRQHAGLAVLDGGEVDDGAAEPEPEQALAHGGDALVEDAKHAEALLGLPYAHC